MATTTAPAIVTDDGWKRTGEEIPTCWDCKRETLEALHSITTSDLAELRYAAGAHGDDEQAALCDRAIGDDDDNEAWCKCAETILAGQG